MQIGFMPGKGTTDAIYIMRQVQEKHQATEVIPSNISAGTGSSWSLCHPVGMWCDAALSRTVRNIFSSLWQSVGS